jgi:RNA polymerase-interacting CarD/CdnL/TRCF family regulator
MKLDHQRTTDIMERLQTQNIVKMDMVINKIGRKCVERLQKKIDHRSYHNSTNPLAKEIEVIPERAHVHVHGWNVSGR